MKRYRIYMISGLIALFCVGNAYSAGYMKLGDIKGESTESTSNSNSTKEVTTGPAEVQKGLQYIHKPDSTMYHPSRGEAAVAAPGSRYIHRPDSTMYHPGGTSASAVSGMKYIHRPDSTMYHPQKETK